MFLKTIKSKIFNDFKDLWVFKGDINISELKYNDGEVIDSKFVSISEFTNMLNEKLIVPNVDFNEEDFLEAINLEKATSYELIDQTVRIEIPKSVMKKDKNIGTSFPINFGVIPDVLDGDGKKLECYIVGTENIKNEFTGKCIAVLHKFDNTEDKLIVTQSDKNFSDNEIREILKFQEKNYLNEIIR
ncbi:hypothetical protein D3C72_1596630 [compost metagenome]